MIKFLRAKSEQCAKEIIAFLLKHEMWQDTYIYANGKRFSDYDGNYHYDNTWDCVFVEEGVNPKNYLEWTGDFLCMTFEGPLYEVLNYYLSFKYCDKLIAEFNAIINKYGYYYELGHAWSLALYKM